MIGFAEVNEIKIRYQSQGKGEPVVLLRGIGENSDWWEPEVVERLSGSFNVILPDNRGTGYSPASRDNEFTIGLMASDLAGLLRELDIETANIVGMSMGGMIALEFAITFPQMARKIIPCSTRCGGKKSIMPVPGLLTTILDGRGGLDAVLGRSASVLFTPDYIEENPDRIAGLKKRASIKPTSGRNLAKQFMAVAAFDRCDALPSIEAPTLVLAGDGDELIPAGNAEIIAGLIPGASLKIYENASHGISNQYPERFCEDVTAFING